MLPRWSPSNQVTDDVYKERLNIIKDKELLFPPSTPMSGTSWQLFIIYD